MNKWVSVTVSTEIYTDGLTLQRRPRHRPPMMGLTDFRVPVCQEQERTVILLFQRFSILGTRGGDEAEKVQEDGLYAVGVPCLCESGCSGEVGVATRS